jgi:hephaestin
MKRTMLVIGFLLASCTLACRPTAHSEGAVSQNSSGGQTRTYYIAADDVMWDYVPGGLDGITGEPFKAVGYFRNPKSAMIGFQQTNPIVKPVSTQYLKTVYREYTDNTFKTLKPRSAEWDHLGMLGPLIRAEVGDTIRVIFRNNGNKPYSIHPHGVFYNKDSEGAPYNDGTSGKDKGDDGVQPGETHEYVWQVPERAGPASMDVNSVLWMYHSHTDEVRDPNTGLLGPMIITGRGQSKPDGTPKGVDRELVIWFALVHEEDSWHVARNLPTIEKDEAITPPSPSINGFAHGSMPLKALTVRNLGNLWRRL